MDKIKMKTSDITEENIEKIAQIFPNCITEAKDEDGNMVRKVDFDILKQELSKEAVEGADERYRLDWPGKRASILRANTPIEDKTLRPVKEESENFDKTENLYIEGDNFEVLKLLQESYLKKVKMIYIDPPYNTGKDFIYKDNFKQTEEDYNKETEAVDAEGYKLYKNTTTNGRYHSDWLSMMYERLIVAKDLLRDDGVIFISIDDNEVHNLRKICDEIFGEENFVGELTWLKKRKGSFLSKNIVSVTEYILVYSKTKNVKLYGGKADSSESQPLVKRTNSINILEFPKNLVKTKIPDGTYKKGKYGEGSSAVELLNEIQVKNGVIISDFSLKGPFIWSQSFLNEQISLGCKVIINTKNFQVRVFKIQGDDSYKGISSIIIGIDINATNESGYEELRDILGQENIMSYPKPTELISYLVKACLNWSQDDIILDFFAGSGTTGDAVMQLNAEDGGNRKYIMVQIPEETDKKSEAYKAGYKTISDIGKERIRRAGKKIKEDNQDKDLSNVDFGFRVFKVDSTNMKDVYYNPKELTQDMLPDLESNIKEDRTPEDLLTQVMLNLGLSLSSKIEEKEILGNKVFFVEDNSLVACFDRDINFEIINEIAKEKPLQVVFKDSSFKEDKDKINLEEKFKLLSSETKIKVI